MKESEIQRAVFDEIASRGMPGVVAWAVPNNREARRTVGFKAGVSDVHCVFQGEFFALELKTDDGEPSSEQIKYVKDIRATKGNAEFAFGLTQAICLLEAWGLLRKAA